jgi:hypothetical protein
MEELFNYYTSQTGIIIPQNVQKYYLNYDGNSRFLEFLKSQIDSTKKGYYPELLVLISEKFAKEILTLIFKFPYEERITDLFKIVCEYNKYGKDIIIERSIEDFVIEEILYSVIDYNYKENKFGFPLIQKAYKNINFNSEEVKIILRLWIDCGGEGGLIIRGKNVGCDTVYSHNEDSKIKFNGKIYEYKGFFFEEYEKSHKPF